MPHPESTNRTPALAALVALVALVAAGFLAAAGGAWGQYPETSLAAPPRPPATPSPAIPADPYGLAVPAAQPAQPVAVMQADPSTVLGPGDQITFAIAEDRDLPIQLRITDTGELEVPYIGRVQVSGKTAGQAAAEIKRRLEADYYFSATVRIGIDQISRTVAMGKIFVSGLVRAPGPVPIVAGEKITLSGVILKAGGFLQFADSRKVRVTRKTRQGTQQMTVDVKAILEQGKLDQDVELKDGDYVNVPQRLINW